MKISLVAVRVMPRHSIGFLPIKLLDPGPGPACWPGTRPGALPLYPVYPITKCGAWTTDLGLCLKSGLVAGMVMPRQGTLEAFYL